MKVIEFGVHDFMRNQDSVDVVGRCYKGPIAVGVHFTKAIAHGSDQVLLIDLQVVRILAYEKELDELEEGVSARLLFEGRTGDLSGGWVLQGVDDRC